MSQHLLTDWIDLRFTASRQGIVDPASCRVMCGQCGSELVETSEHGLIHYDDCTNHEHILFLKQNEETGEWLAEGLK